MDDHENDDDYKVGYGRTPVESRWKKGQSGNPRGRPKRDNGIGASIMNALLETVPVEKNGRMTRLSRKDVMFNNLANKAAKGDPHAIKIVIQTIKEFCPRGALGPTVLRIIGGLPDQD